MTYADMCRKAEETGAIRRPVYVEYNENDEGQLVAKAWTVEDLWEMLTETWSITKYKDSQKYFACGFFGDFLSSSKQLGEEFDTPQEALLWAVMFEKGWLWTGHEFKLQARPA